MSSRSRVLRLTVALMLAVLLSIGASCASSTPSESQYPDNSLDLSAANEQTLAEVADRFAALATGNTVLAKPAEQTPGVALEAVKLLHAAGVPIGALQLLHGPGETVGAALVAAPGVAGVVFTGSTPVAKIIQRALAATQE